MKTMLEALATLALAVVTHAQDEAKPQSGWTRAYAQDGKSWVWTLKDSEGKGASLVFHCEGDSVELRSTESLLDLADPDDVKLRIAGLALNDKRVSVDGFLAGDHHGVRLEGDTLDEFRSWLHFDARGQKLTLFLSGGGKKLILGFDNRSLIPGVDHFDCEMPKEKK